MPGESLMDIELLDNYIHCEYFSMVRREVMCLLTSLYGKNLLYLSTIKNLTIPLIVSISLFKYLFIGLYYSGAVVAVIRDSPEAAANVWCGCRGKLHCLHILEHL